MGQKKGFEIVSVALVGLEDKNFDCTVKVIEDGNMCLLFKVEFKRTYSNEISPAQLILNGGAKRKHSSMKFV